MYDNDTPTAREISASLTRLAEIMEHLEDVTLSDSANRNRVADILTHVVHARDGLITGEEMLLKISKLLGVPFYDVYGRPTIDGRDPD